MIKATLALAFCLSLILSAAGRTIPARQAAGKSGSSIEQLIRDFSSKDWQKVRMAESVLESRQAEAIPALIKLLDSDKRLELQNTADLIYPGAKQFYGHGRLLDYDVDWLSVRAGWALEETTFQNFGFREGAISEEELFKAVSRGQQGLPLKETPASHNPEMKGRLRAEAVSRAKAWWQKNANSWTRFEALLEALRSDDPVRHLWTLNWIRYGETRCDGLNMESFRKYVLPEVKRLLESKDAGVRDQAKDLMEDDKGRWLKYKTGEDN
jgi:hypothetical protein